MRTRATPRSMEGMTLMEINAGDTAWVLVSAALVFLMTPGLAFFYGGMVRVKSVLNMMMMSAITIGVVTVLWVVVGYSLTFGGDNGGVIGNFSVAGLKGLIAPDAVSGTIPTLAFVAFQLMFAIITPALISGAIADRATFRGWIAFVARWTSLVYFPVAHSVWFLDDGDGGWIGDKLKAIDFAGGTAVHVNAGAAALALAIVLGKRVGWRKDPMRPHSLPLVVLGAGLLWFGWFGFNAGSALTAGTTAAVTFVNTQVATAAAVIGWLIVERIRHGKATTLGMASGAVAGLVAITPACGAVTPVGSMILGVVAGAHLRLRGLAEVQARLRRLARRGRRAPGRRSGRLAGDRLPGHARPRRQRWTVCSTVAVPGSSAGRRWPTWSSVSTRSWSPSSWPS